MRDELRYLRQRRTRRGGSAAWSVDATSNIAVPANSEEWGAFITSNGLSVTAPDALWLMQEASGNLADSIGTFTLTASGTGATYQSSVTGWSRKALSFASEADALFTNTAAGLPNIATESQLTLLIGSFGTPAGNRAFVWHGTTSNRLMIESATRKLRANSNGNVADGAADFTGVVRPLGLRTNRTAGSCTGFSDVDKISPTFSTAVTGERILLGGGPSPPFSVLYMAQWHAANAEISDANYKALLQAMGFTITWT